MKNLKEINNFYSTDKEAEGEAQGEKGYEEYLSRIEEKIKNIKDLGEFVLDNVMKNTKEDPKNTINEEQ